MGSFGVLLYQMITGGLPCKGKKDVEVIRLIIKDDYTIPNTIKPHIKDLIKGLIEKNEEKRIKLNDLFNQQYFKEQK